MDTKETPPEKIGWGVAPRYVGALGLGWFVPQGAILDKRVPELGELEDGNPAIDSPPDDDRA